MSKDKVILNREGKVSYTFDPVRDIAAVEQFGFVDLVKANLASSVPSTIEAPDEKYNGIEDPASIAGRPRDLFEQAQGSKVIASYTPPAVSLEDTTKE